MSLDSTLQISNEENSAIRNLEGRQAQTPYVISLSWEVLESMARYEVVCSSSLLTSTVRVDDGASTSATVTVVPFSDAGGEYRCCVTAFQSDTLFNLVELTSSKCVSVVLDRTISSIQLLQVGGSVSTTPTAAFPSDSSSARELDPVVTYALGGLSGLLIIAIVLLAVGCFCVVLSKRRDQMTYPKE